MSALESGSVRRVQAALVAAGSAARVVELARTARSAADAARALGVEVGQIVKSLLFTVQGRPVLALVAGDRQCDPEGLARALGGAGTAQRADAALVREATGFAIGGVAPLGHPAPLPTLIDPSLGRFARVWAAAGHPHCVFETSLGELLALTGGRAAAEIAA
ncbi:MAG TPA: YbaK/EbsC family protein [Geminicoccaceae bacterium]|nr:YbaK/EbsC family protein [Geminicoccaceae bacterium]